MFLMSEILGWLHLSHIKPQINIFLICKTQASHLSKEPHMI